MHLYLAAITLFSISAQAQAGGLVSSKYLGLNQDFDFTFTGNNTFAPAGTDDTVINTDADSSFIVNSSHSGGNNWPTLNSTHATGSAGLLFTNTADLNDLWFLVRLHTGAFALQYGATTSVSLNIMNFDQVGNASIGGATAWGAGAAKNFAIKNGTAPTTSPTDQIALWSADFAATDARMNLRSESGTAMTFGNNEILMGVVTSLPTCDATRPGGIKIYQKGSGGTEQTSMCICHELAGVWSWSAVPSVGDCT